MHNPNQLLFFAANSATDCADFATLVGQLENGLMPYTDICNLQSDRLMFSASLAATLLSGKPTILPPSDAPDAIAASLGDAEVPCMLDRSVNLRGHQWRVPAAARSCAELFEELAGSQAEIRVFTSGTSKQPECILKSWDILRAGAAITDGILDGLDADPEDIALLGTTPARHMFGLEATIFATLGFGRCCYRDTIFYPADLEVALESARSIGRSRLVLVTSPAHLKFLEATIMSAPEICCVLSATAPLSREQAERLEARGDLRVMEIYGSSETGSLAFRRSVRDVLWTPAAGFVLQEEDGVCVADAPHLIDPIRLRDEVSLHADGRFELLGRIGDLVNIRGKRSRLSALNAVLSEAPGLADGVYLHTQTSDADQLAIVVVPANPETHTGRVKQVVREYMLKHFDPVFVPKRVLVLPQIRRTPTGKIAHKETEALKKQAGIGGS